MPEHVLSTGQFFHHSPQHHRENIETEGLKPYSPYEGPKGVYLHTSVEGARQYMKGQSSEADDLYEVTLPPKWKTRPDPLLETAVVSSRPIPSQHVRRVNV